MSPPFQTIPIDWSVQLIVMGSTTFQIGRLLVAPCFPLSASGLLSSPEVCWFDSGAPLSVIPFHVHYQRLHWQAIGIQATWCGQTCDLGRIEVWFGAAPSAPLSGPFSLLAKFPRSDPPGPPVPVLLGLEFMLAYQAHLAIPPPPGRGNMQVP